LEEVILIDHVRNEEELHASRGEEEYPVTKKKKEGVLDWSHVT
jgi:hypothetical protein